MKIDDRVYGEKIITEDVLIELINSDPVQRLKSISQSGPQPFFIDKKLMTRFEHSLGVMILLREHEASLEEQIAGLLHDVPHTAFSHLVDFAFDNEDHDYHDNFLEEVVMDSEIPEILRKHGLDVDYILDEDSFGLLERDSPDLCADRIDYFLRDSKAYGGWDVGEFVDALDTEEGMFVLKDTDVAVEYGLKFIEADENWWANPRESALNKVFGQVINEALGKEIIEEEDLFGTDEELLEVLKNSENDLIQEKLDALEGGFEIVVGADNPDFTVYPKPRFVDPPVIANQSICKASDFSEKLETRIKEHRNEVKSGYSIKLK